MKEGEQRPIDNMSVSPAAAYTARKHMALSAGKWEDALAAAYEALRHCTARPEDVFMLRENARDYAELSLALQPDVPPTQLAPLVFSLVAPNDWPGSRGVAAHILGVRSTRVGDVCTVAIAEPEKPPLRVRYEPSLVAAHRACALCDEPKGTRACARCGACHYCSEDHQRRHWEGGHKLVCVRHKPETLPLFADVAVHRERLERYRDLVRDMGFHKVMREMQGKMQQEANGN